MVSVFQRQLLVDYIFPLGLLVEGCIFESNNVLTLETRFSSFQHIPFLFYFLLFKTSLCYLCTKNQTDSKVKVFSGLHSFPELM